MRTRGDPYGMVMVLAVAGLVALSVVAAIGTGSFQEDTYQAPGSPGSGSNLAGGWVDPLSAERETAAKAQREMAGHQSSRPPIVQERPAEAPRHPITGYPLPRVEAFLISERSWAPNGIPMRDGMTMADVRKTLYAARRRLLLQAFPDADNFRDHADTEASRVLDLLRARPGWRPGADETDEGFVLAWRGLLREKAPGVILDRGFLASLWTLTRPEAVKALEDASDGR